MPAPPPDTRGPEAAAGRRRRGKLPLLLFLAALLVYNLNFQRIASGDTAPASLVPFSILLDGSVSLGRFYPWFQQHASPLRYAFRVSNGQVYSDYPIALPLLVTPLYVPAALVVHFGNWPVERIITLAAILEKLSASLIAAASVAFFFLLARRITGSSIALLLTLIYAFATETWTISSQALWQHGASELAIIGALYFFVRGGNLPARGTDWLFCGLFAGLALAVRPNNGLFVLAAGAYLLVARKLRAVALFSVFPLLAAVFTAAYNYPIFGSVLGRHNLWMGDNLWRGLAGVLFSPGRGLFFYSPVFLFALLGAGFCLRDKTCRRSAVYVVSLAFAAVEIALVSLWPIWWGGHCYGPRLLTDIVPCLVLLMIPAMDRVRNSVFWRAAFVATLAASVFVQAVGAFCYPNSRWDETPAAVGNRVSRLWDWRDNPLFRSVKAGPRLGPAPGSRDRIRGVFGAARPADSE